MWPFGGEKRRREQDAAVVREVKRLLRPWRYRQSWGIASEGVIGQTWDWKVGGYASVCVVFCPPGDNRALWRCGPGAVLLAWPKGG